MMTLLVGPTYNKTFVNNKTNKWNEVTAQIC